MRLILSEFWLLYCRILICLCPPPTHTYILFTANISVTLFNLSYQFSTYLSPQLSLFCAYFLYINFLFVSILFFYRGTFFVLYNCQQRKTQLKDKDFDFYLVVKIKCYFQYSLTSHVFYACVFLPLTKTTLLIIELYMNSVRKLR